MLVTREMYAIGARKYIDIDGKRVKVPWRYNRPMVETIGLKTIFEYKTGDDIHCVIEPKLWEGDVYLVLKSILD